MDTTLLDEKVLTNLILLMVLREEIILDYLVGPKFNIKCLIRNVKCLIRYTKRRQGGNVITSEPGVMQLQAQE